MFLECGSLDHSLCETEQRIRKAEAILFKLTIRKKYRNQIEKTLLQLFQPSQKIAEHYGIPFRL